jgi:hypothetical protein
VVEVTVLQLLQMHICITEEMISHYFFIIIVVVCHEFVLLLLNNCYFEILPFISEGLSLDAPFNLGSIVKTIMELVMNATTVSMWKVGGRGEELLNMLKYSFYYG